MLIFYYGVCFSGPTQLAQILLQEGVHSCIERSLDSASQDSFARCKLCFPTIEMKSFKFWSHELSCFITWL